MNTLDIRGLEELEGAVLDDTASLATALRRCLMLGGYAHHQELRAWARKELNGYGRDDELPDFRKIPAALEATTDVYLPGVIQRGVNQRLSVNQLPKAARDRGIGEMAPIRFGVKELEVLIARFDKVANIGPPGAAEFAIFMNRQQEDADTGIRITSIHWAIAIPSIEGILDRIRTDLTLFVAEVRAAMPPGQQNPNPRQIAQAAQQAFDVKTGNNSPVHVYAPSATAEGGGSASANVNDPAPAPAQVQPWWHRSAVIWTALGVLVAAAGVVATVLVAK